MENVNGNVIYRTVSKKTFEMMSDRTRERFTVVDKVEPEPKKIPIPAETIALMEKKAEPIEETEIETQTPEDNDYPKQEVVKAIPAKQTGVGTAKKTRKRRSV